ncbi:CDK5 and ABL1 enzyme substrate [Acrasis kona]
MYYEHMLSQCNDDKESNYDPHFLDDPNMRCGYKRKVMNLPGIISSTIPFVKTKALAEELNEQFRDRHGDRITLTLSKIRNLKKKMLSAAFPDGLYNVHHHYHHGYSSSSAHLNDISMDAACKESAPTDISTVTLAIVYLERLIINGFVDDKNRKLVAATCLFLAFKLNNEITSAQERNKHLGQLMDQLESSIGVNKKQILSNEFTIFANLGFDLVVPMNQLMPHMKRILEEQGIKLEEYMGEAMYEKYVVRRTVL